MHHFFFFNDTATTEIYTLSLHDALPISSSPPCARSCARPRSRGTSSDRRCRPERSEEHTSELQSQSNLVCRLLLEKKNGGDKFGRTGVYVSTCRFVCGLVDVRHATY